MSNRLFEQLREFVGSGGWEKTLAADLLPVGDLASLVRDIETADVRYILAPEVSAGAWQVAVAKPESLMKAWDHLRVPADVVWIEWPDRLRRQMFNDLMGIREDLDPLQFHPEKSGVLIHADHGGRHGTMRWIWGAGGTSEFPLSGHTSILEAEFDFDDPTLGDRTHIEATLGHGASFDPGMWFAVRDPRSPRTDVVRKHFRFRMAPAWQDALATLAPRMRVPAYNDLQQRGANDLAGEVEHVLATLLMLVARQATDRKDVTEDQLAKLNKSRVKRGKPPLLGHREITMKLSAVRLRRTGAGTSGSTSTKALHLVIGHFKTRKSGVYWWNPFFRGDPAKGGSGSGRTVRVKS